METSSVRYYIEVWDPNVRRYVAVWSGTDRERASIMYHKPYYKGLTRKLVKVTRTIDLLAKGKK